MATAAILDLQNLVDLLDELRLAGYDISTQQYISAQNLLIALAAKGQLPDNLSGLRTWLAPVICSSPREQENFYRFFDRWIARHPELITSSTGPQRTASATEEIGQTEKSWRDLFRAPIVVLGFTILLIALGGLFLLRMRSSSQVTGSIIDDDTNQTLPGAVISFNGQKQTTANDGAFAISYRQTELPKDLMVENNGYEPSGVKITTETKSPLVIRLQKPPTPEPIGATPTPVPTAPPIALIEVAPIDDLPTWKGHKWISFSALFFPLFLFAGWWLWQSKFNRGLLRKLQRGKEPRLAQLFVKGLGGQLFQGQSVRRTIQELRRHRQRGAYDLDAPRTVRSTIGNGGLFTPAYGSRQTLPEYLVLIDRASLGDHQAKLGEELVRRLIQDNVFVDSYHYQGDARFCRRAQGNSAYVSLQEMAARHPDHYLILFSDGSSFFNPLNGEPERWLENFAPWAKRILMTPEPPASWGLRERMLGELGFTVLPAGARGLADLSEVVADNVPKIDAGRYPRPYPSMLRQNPKRWLDSHEPQAAKANRLCDQIKVFLGARGYHWLAACAIYPLLYWELTLLLGHKLFHDRQQLENRLLSLVRLPWFRYGSLPDWLRLRLISSLSAEDEKSVRKLLEELFLTMIDQPADGMRLDIATEPARAPNLFQKLKQRMAAWKFRLFFRQVLRNQSPDSPLRDYVFLSFMLNRKPRKLSVTLPDTIRRLIFPQGQVALGMRPISALLLVIIFSASVFFINRRVSAGGTTQPTANRFYSDMTAPEQLQFVQQKMQEVCKAMGATEFQMTTGEGAYYKQLVDEWAGRVGNKSTAHADEDLAFVFGRATSEFAPAISQAFRDRGISPLIGLYAAMSASGYQASAVDKDRDTAGLFGLTTAKAREIGLTAAERLDRNKMIAKAAASARDVQDRSSDDSQGKLMLTLMNYGVQFKPGPLKIAPVFADLATASVDDTHRPDRILAAAIIGENPRAFRLDMNPLSSYTTITAENSSEIADLVSRLGGSDRKAASARLVEMYAENKTAVIQALVDAIQPDSSSSYHSNLYIAVTLGSIKPSWEGTAEQIGKVMTLQKSRDYQDKTFQPWVDKAINNFDRKRIIDCDCGNVSAGLLTREYQKQCATREDQLWQEIKDTGHLTGLCDSVASGPNAKPNANAQPVSSARSPREVPPTPVLTPPPSNQLLILTANPTQVEEGQPVIFKVRVVRAPSDVGILKSLHIIFGDGNTQPGGSQVHAYSSAGSYVAYAGAEIDVNGGAGFPFSSPITIVVVPKSSATIPNLIGKTASDVLKNPKMEFALGNVSYKDDSAHQAGTVLSQSPVAGTRAPNGTKIDIVVAQSPRGSDDGLVEVPSVRGLTPEKAEKTIEGLGLKAKTDYIASNEASQIPMMIAEQSPAAGTRVKPGTLVKLTACPDGKCK